MRTKALLCIFIAGAGLFTVPGEGATLTWDATGNNAVSPSDGGGTWSLTGTNWSNGASDGGWASGDDAVIGDGGTAGTITLSGSQSVNSITFNPVTSGSYTLSSGTIGLLDGAITVNSSGASIGSVVSGTAGLSKSGTGTLTLSGADVYAGTTSVLSGLLNVAGSISSSSPIVIGSNGSTGATFKIALPGNVNIASLTTASGATGSTLSMNQSTNAFFQITGVTTLNSPLTITKANNGAYAVFEPTGITGTGGGTGNDTLIFSNPGGIQGYVQGNTGTYNFSGNVHFLTTNGQNWIFQGASIFPSTASVTLDSGALLSNNTGSAFNIDGLNGAGTWNGSNDTLTLGSANGSDTFSGVLGGSWSVVKTGTGTQILSGADAYSGTTAVNRGTLQIGNNGTTGVLPATAVSGSSGAILAFNRTDSIVSNSTISGGLSVTQAGTGMLTLGSVANSFTGGVTIASGTLQVNADGVLGGAASGITFSGAGTLRSGSSATLASTRGITINSGVTATFDSNGNNLGINGAIAGTNGALTKIGAGSLILAGTDTYTGMTTINNGTVFVNGSLTSSAVTANNGGGLGGTGAVSQLVTVNGGGAINLVDGSIGTLTLANGLTIGNNATPSMLDFEGSGSGFDLLNDSASVLTLSGSATINITVLGNLNSGTYNLITFGSLSGSLANFTLASNSVGGKTLSLLSTGTSEELVVLGSTVYWKGGNGTSWNASGPTNWTADAAGTTGTSAPSALVDVDFSANGVTGPLTTSLGANFDVNSINFLSGATGSTAISDGTFGLKLEGGGISVNAGAGAVTVSATGVTLDASQSWTNNSSNALTVSSLVLGAAASSATTALILSGTGAGGILLSGTISDGATGGKLALMIDGSAGVATLAANNSYSGGTIISSGTLRVGNGGAMGTLGAGPVTVNGILVFNRSDNPGVSNSITDNGSVVNAGSGTVTVSTAIGGSGNIAQAGSGRLILTASNTYSGGTTIGAGTLQLGDGVTNNGYLNGNITDNTTVAFANPLAETYSGVVSGSGAIVKSGAGTLTLSGINTNSSKIIIESGTLILNANATTPTYLLGDAGTGSNNVTLKIGSGYTNASTPLLNIVTTGSGTGTQTIDVSGAGTGALRYNLVLGGTTILKGPLNQILGTISGPGAGAGNTSLIIDVNGGNFVWSGGENQTADSFAGNVHFIDSSATPGTLQMQNNAYLGNTAVNQNLMIPDSSSVTVDSNVTWAITHGVETIDALNGSGPIRPTGGTSYLANTPILTVGAAGGSGTYSGVMADSGGVAFSLGKSGTGTEILTGANTYSGGTIINQGMVQIGAGGTNGAINSAAAVSGSAGGVLVFDRSDSVDINNVISGGIGLTQAGSGTLTIDNSGSYSYTGTTTVTNGTVIVAGNISGGGPVNVTRGTLGGNGNITGNVTIGSGATFNSSAGGAGTPSLNDLSIGGNLSLSSSSSFQFSLDSGNPSASLAFPGNSDDVLISGSLTLAGKVILGGFDIGNSALDPNSGDVYVVADASLGISGTFANSLLQVGQNWFAVSYQPDGFDGTDVVLTVTSVPEPGMWPAIFGCFAMLIAFQRRRGRLMA